MENQNIELLNITPNAFQIYTETTRGNSGISMLEARKKLTRNVLLSVRSRETKSGNVWYLYGRLYILVRNNTVIHVSNHNRTPDEWEEDYNRKQELNKILGLI